MTTFLLLLSWTILGLGLGGLIRFAQLGPARSRYSSCMATAALGGLASGLLWTWAIDLPLEFLSGHLIVAAPGAALSCLLASVLPMGRGETQTVASRDSISMPQPIRSPEMRRVLNT
jgi:hypothetical protein